MLLLRFGFFTQQQNAVNIFQEVHTHLFYHALALLHEHTLFCRTTLLVLGIQVISSFSLF